MAACTAPAPQSNSQPAEEKEAITPPSAIKHDPAHPPIDCPLRKQGIDPGKLKPFEQMEAYINFLDQKSRKVWQKPQEVVAAMQLKGHERVLDLGAGSGYFSFPIAEKLPLGRLFAADVEPEMVRHIHHKAMTQGAKNIEVLLIDPEKPKLPENIDIVFICDVIHHVKNPQDWLTGITAQLPLGAQMHIIEFKPGDLPSGPPESVKMAPEKLIEMVQSSGLRLEKRLDELLPYQNYYVFKK